MGFQLFDREQVAAANAGRVGPLVRVDVTGRLLFNAPALEFLQGMYDRLPSEVMLLFDVDDRTAAVQAVAHVDLPSLPAGVRWQTHTLRGFEWPRAVRAVEFCVHHQIGDGVYPARWRDGTLLFDVGEPRALPPLPQSGGPEVLLDAGATTLTAEQVADVQKRRAPVRGVV